MPSTVPVGPTATALHQLIGDIKVLRCVAPPDRSLRRRPPSVPIEIAASPTREVGS
jgi:exonuclease V gamma subunit